LKTKVKTKLAGVAWRIIIIIIKAADDAMHARQKKTNRGDSQQQHKAAT